MWTRVNGTYLSAGLPASVLNRSLYRAPLAVCTAAQMLPQFSDGTLVCLLRTAGAVIVQPDRQFLKGHALFIGLADPQITVHQIQLSGLEHFLHALEKQRPAHETVIGPGRITVKTNVKDTITQGLNLEHSAVFLQQTLGHFDGNFQLLLNGGQKICVGVLLVCGIEESHLAQLVVTIQRK